MTCGVCGLPCERETVWGLCCNECEFLACLPTSVSEFGKQLDEWSRKQWRAHRRKEPFAEEPPKSRAEIACEEFAIRCAEIEARRG